MQSRPMERRVVASAERQRFTTVAPANRIDDFRVGAGRRVPEGGGLVEGALVAEDKSNFFSEPSEPMCLRVRIS